MKISRSSQGENFYESFSDLLFATMAIFVLLLFLLIGQFKEEQEARLEEQAEKLQQEKALAKITATFDELQEKLKESTRENAQADQREEDLIKNLRALEQASRQKEEELKKIEREFANAIKIDSLQLFVLIDGSSSMTVPLENLSTAIRYLAEKLPNVATEFSLSIIVYRDNSALSLGDKSAYFDFATINSLSDDGGLSYSKLVRFLNEDLQIRGGAVDPEKALKSMERIISTSLSPDAKAALWLISDVGCSEIDGYSGNHGSEDERAEDRFISRVVNLMERYPNLKFGVVYPNEGSHLHPNNFPHYSATMRLDQASLYAITPTTKKFFDMLIARTGQDSRYETSSDRLLPELMLSILGEKQ